MHYARLRKHGDPTVGGRNVVEGFCTVSGCDSPQYARKHCHGHYKRLIENRAVEGRVRDRNHWVDGMKVCPGCKIRQPESNFARTQERRSSWCKECHKYSQKMIKYGLSRDEFTSITRNGCQICGATDKLVIDHHHNSGYVRGALCTQCNVAIGMAHESPERLEAMAEYLRTHTVKLGQGSKTAPQEQKQ